MELDAGRDPAPTALAGGGMPVERHDDAQLLRLPAREAWQEPRGSTGVTVSVHRAEQIVAVDQQQLGGLTPGSPAEPPSRLSRRHVARWLPSDSAPAR